MTFIDLYLSHITLLGARGGNGAQPYRLAKMTSVRQFGPGWEPGPGSDCPKRLGGQWGSTSYTWSWDPTQCRHLHLRAC